MLYPPALDSVQSDAIDRDRPRPEPRGVRDMILYSESITSYWPDPSPGDANTRGSTRLAAKIMSRKDLPPFKRNSQPSRVLALTEAVFAN